MGAVEMGPVEHLALMAALAGGGGCVLGSLLPWRTWVTWRPELVRESILVPQQATLAV